MPTTIWGAINAKLVANAPLATLLGGDADARINYGRRPNPLVYPYIMYQSTGGSTEWHAPATPGAPYTEEILMQLDVYDTDPDRIDSIVLAVAPLLDFASLDTFNSILIKLQRTSSLEDKILETETGDPAGDVWHVPMLYEVTLQKAI